jgi:two-component system cell cycle sensor histidine kinase/response regulator CckA
MRKSELMSQRLDTLEQCFQNLKDQADELPAAREVLAPALQKVALAIARLRTAREGGLSPAADSPDGQTDPLRQPEANLVRSESILRQVFRAVTDVFIILDRDLNIISTNWPGYKELKQAARSGQIKCYQAFHGLERPCKECHVDQVLATGQPLVVEKFNPLDNRIYETTAIPIPDESGQVVQVAETWRDITALRQTEKSLKEREDLYRVLTERSLVGVYLLQGGKFRYANVKMAQVFGYAPEEIIDRLSPQDLIYPEDHPLLEEQVRRRLSGEAEEAHYTARGVRQDGTVIHLEFLGRRVEYKGWPAIVGTLLDITERKQAEGNLEFQAQLLDLARDTIVAHDLKGHIVYVNEAAAQARGYTREELLGKTIPDLIAPGEARQKGLQRLSELQAGKLLDPFESYHVRKDGSRFPIEVHGRLTQINGRKIFLGVARDITERRRAQEELATHLEFMGVILDAIPNPIFYKDREGVYLGCNRAFGDLMGITPEEIVGKTVHDIHPKELADKYQQMDWKVLQNRGSQVYERALQTGDGIVHNVVIHKATFPDAKGNVAGLVGNIVDISDLKRAEEAVRESEARLRAIFEHAPVGITMVDPAGRFLQTNPAFQAIVGYSATELQNMTFQQITHPEDLPGNLQLLKEFLANKRQYYYLQKRYMRKDGKIVWVSLMKSRVQNAQGETRVIGTVLDITARKQAEEALRESEQRFRLMAKTIQDVLWISTPSLDKVIYVSPAYEKVWGRSCEELYESPRSFLEAIHPEDRKQAQALMMTHQSRGLEFSQEYRIIKLEGSISWIHNQAFPVKDEQGKVIMYTGVAKDITERKNLEQQLLLAQKMEAVGRLAGGVAHDFNNLLMAIASYAELIRQKIFKGDPLYRYLEDIFHATDRATALTGQLLTFSRQQIVHPRVVDLNQLVRDLKRLLRRLIPEDIELEVITAPELGMVKADPGYLNQIIMNLVINARDAMPCGGCITLETTEVRLQESRRTRSGESPPGPYVVLKVIDSGIGIDESIQVHIFEPFFTTKEPGKGTGLGLSIVYGIIKQSGGFIDLESKPGQGSTFTIYLPRLEDGAELDKTRTSKQRKLRGEETILLVEDEDVLRSLLAKFMRLQGYTVLEARHGDEALLICEKYQGPIQLMVTDVVMPLMSGRVLADRIRSLRPETKVLYMSGYTEDEVVQRGVADLSVSFLQKPFKPIDLARQVRAVLNPPPRQ